VTPGYRNDLSALWRVTVKETDDGDGLRLKLLEVFPNKIDWFRARVLERTDGEHQWVREKIVVLSKELGTEFDGSLGERGQLVLSL